MCWAHSSATHPWCLPLPTLQPPRALGPHRAGPWSESSNMFSNMSSKMNGGMFSIMLSVLNRSVQKIIFLEAI